MGREIKIRGTKITFRKILRVYDVTLADATTFNTKTALLINDREVIRKLLPRLLGYVPDAVCTVRANLMTYVVPIDESWKRVDDRLVTTLYCLVFTSLPVPYPRRVWICAKVLMGVRVWHDKRVLDPEKVAEFYAYNVVSGHISKRLKKLAENVLRYVREGPKCKCVFRIETPDEKYRYVETWVRTYKCKCGRICLGTYDLLMHIYHDHKGSLRNVTVEEKIHVLSRAVEQARVHGLERVALKLESIIERLEEGRENDHPQ